MATITDEEAVCPECGKNGRYYLRKDGKKKFHCFECGYDNWNKEE